MERIVRTILVADDDESTRDLYMEELVDEGHRVLTAENGMQALGLLEDETIDLLLTDVKMPDMDAREMLPQVKVLYPGLPVIVMTAFPETHLEFDEKHFEVAAFLIKPVDLEEMKAEVRKALRETPLE